jgi:FKBP-type peptidyl-prolyl cis-trans isomerase
MRKSSTLLTGFAMLSLSALLLAADAPTSQPANHKTVTASGLTIIDQGHENLVARAGDKVWVEYTGKLENGTVFDASSKHPDQPLIFTLGQGQVIRGWDEGIAGMKVGDKRQLIIPAKLGYGDRAAGEIPPNSTLIFDVQLLGIQRGG